MCLDQDAFCPEGVRVVASGYAGSPIRIQKLGLVELALTSGCIQSPKNKLNTYCCTHTHACACRSMHKSNIQFPCSGVPLHPARIMKESTVGLPFFTTRNECPPTTLALEHTSRRGTCMYESIRIWLGGWARACTPHTCGCFEKPFHPSCSRVWI